MRMPPTGSGIGALVLGEVVGCAAWLEEIEL